MIGQRTHKRPGRVFPVIVPAVLGLIFCVLNLAGADLLCLSSGCDIYAGYSLGGLSIHALGVGGFGLLLLLALLASRQPAWRWLLLLALVAGLLIDTLFLAWQILYWPCTSCLVVALLLALCVLGARAAFPEFRGPVLKLALLLWLIAFVPVTVAAGKEVLLQPWPILGPADAPVSVFFSPTCPTCEQTVMEILGLPELSGQVAFIPVAKNDQDLQRLARLVGQGEVTDLQALFSPANGAVAEVAAPLRWRLARNKMALASMGVDRVPLVLTPRLVRTAPAPRLPFLDGADPTLDLLGIPQFEPGCAAAESAEEPCE